MLSLTLFMGEYSSPLKHLYLKNATTYPSGIAGMEGFGKP